MQSQVVDVNGHPAMTATGATASVEETRGAILRAAQERGYVVESDDGRTMLARVTSGDIWALMRIDYAAGVYSISHADSSPELRYDASRGTVHRRYNRWVNRLQSSIERELWQPSGPSPSPMPMAVATAPILLGGPPSVPAPPAMQAPPPAAPMPAQASTLPAEPPQGTRAGGSAWVPGSGSVAAPAGAAMPSTGTMPSAGELDI